VGFVVHGVTNGNAGRAKEEYLEEKSKFKQLLAPKVVVSLVVMSCSSERG
jgi:hypothetical protein